MFLAALACSVGIIASNRLWRAPHKWLIACVIAAMSVCVLLHSLSTCPSLAFPFAILVLLPLGALYLS